MKSPKYAELPGFMAKLWGPLGPCWSVTRLHSNTEIENHTQLCKTGFVIVIYPGSSNLSRLSTGILTDSLKGAPKLDP